MRVENANLRAKLASLPVIEQAKGILMGRYQISPDAAFALLRRWSSHTNLKLRDISGSWWTPPATPAATKGSGPLHPPVDDLNLPRRWTSSSPG